MDNICDHLLLDKWLPDLAKCVICFDRNGNLIFLHDRFGEIFLVVIMKMSIGPILAFILGVLGALVLRVDSWAVRGFRPSPLNVGE